MSRCIPARLGRWERLSPCGGSNSVPAGAAAAVRHIRRQRECSGRISRLEVDVLRRALLGMTTKNGGFRRPYSHVGLISGILPIRTVLPDG